MGVRPFDHEPTQEAIARAAEARHTPGAGDKDGKHLFCVDVAMRASGWGEARVFVWAENEDEARQTALEEAPNGYVDEDEVDWRVDDLEDPEVRCVLPADLSEGAALRLTTLPSYAARRGQLFLGSGVAS